MKAERFEQVDQILQAALERDGSEREAFLDEACAGDTALRSKVEALISSDEEAGSFIETPAFEVAATMMAGEQSKIVAGQAIGPYQVASRLGSGGMGDVYLAHDSRLGRKVALKLLPAYFTRDEERLRRFQQEARAASALNHPNIITIFEIGKAESIHFIATEYITGQTLRERMSVGMMKLSEALDIAIQIAGALASAHLEGIVHRDIKPENIMLREDGYVKVLDFGLAKLTEGQVSETEVQTVVKVDTVPGVVMGTASYMSPEQARGHEVDRRTDIFSLGVVVYEMVAGRLPFEGQTTSDVIAAILKQEPEPLARYSREVPEGLEWTVAKALAKDREERYQTVTEMLFDLKRLKQRLDYEAEQQRSLSPDLNVHRVKTSSESISSKTDSEQIVDTGISLSRETSSAEYLISEIKRHKPGALLALVILIIAAAAIGIGLYRLIGQNKPSAPFQTVKISNLTTAGHITHAAISPDGKYVAHVVEDQGNESLWIRQVATTSSQQVVAPADVSYLGLTFSTDGNFIYYTVRESDKPAEGALYQVPVLAGATPPRKLLTNLDSAIAVSPDGKQLAYGVVNSIAKESALMIANTDGTGAYGLVTKNGPQFGDFQWRFSNPAWSPDGKVIAYGGRIKQQSGDGGGRRASVIEVNVKDGSEKPITDHTWLQVGRLAWLPDGSGLIITAAERFGLFQIWHLSYPAGEARRITNDESKNYRGVSLTVDGSVMATTQQDEQSSIWIAPDGDASRARRITPGRYEGRYGVAWTPNGRILYHSFASGNEDIWIMNADGSGQSQLTVNPGTDDDCCEVSPDGRYIVFRSQREDGTALWRMDRDGGNAKRLTSEGNQPTVSPDGRWVIYHRVGRLWKVSIDGGEAAQLNATSGDVGTPAISPDGKLIACYYRDDPNAGPRLAIIPSEGGQPIKLFDSHPVMLRPLKALQWTPDGQAIAYLKTTGGVSNIWSQSLDSDTPKPLTDFKSDSMFSFSWSRDGKQLAYARGSVTSDVVLIRDSK
jgi:serine/threonine protein kinase/Tol biopolymer transport system component